MKPKTYRRLTHLLFAFLFLVFLLLYLLLGGAGIRSQGKGDGWDTLHTQMGTIELSEVRSGGFALEPLPVQTPTSPGDEEFDRNVLCCEAALHNEGTGAIQVTVSVFGTEVLEDAASNEGLTGTYLEYPPETDPFDGGKYGAWMKAASLTEDPQAKNMTLYMTGPDNRITLEAGETRQVAFLFWVDSDQVQTLTDLQREGYSATVKLISRCV